jgi:indole-3-glycerol phosphate synthase
MQAGAWSPPVGTLGRLMAEARDRARQAAHTRTDLEARAAVMPPAPDLLSALVGPTVSVIAEVKRSSPSKGAIAPTLAADAQAARYASGGASAISVLTEPSAFGGSLADLASVTHAVRTPAIRKDFIADEIQLLEARCAGASGVLLIVRGLTSTELARLIAAAVAIGVTPVVETRTLDEIALARDAGARVIGVNNRNLETLVIDPETAERLIPCIPSDCIAIAESGMSSIDDVQRYARVGADAVLVGSMVSAAADPVAAVRGLTGVGRVARAA